MIYEWRHWLVSRGFKKIYRGLFTRPFGPVTGAISESSLRDGSKRVRIDLSIEVHDPFADDESTCARMDLWGEVSTEAIRVHYIRSGNYFSSTPWLAPEEGSAVFAVLERCMEPWFEHWTQPNLLIEYFLHRPDMVSTKPVSGGVEHVDGQHTPWKPATPFAAAFEASVVWAKGAPRGELSPADWFNLSLLYYHVGNRQEALRYAKLYLEHCRVGLPALGEPERTLRQIKALSE